MVGYAPDNIVPRDMQALERAKGKWLLDGALTVSTMDSVTRKLTVMNANIIDNGDFVDVSMAAEITCSRTARFGRDTSVSFVMRNIVKLKAGGGKKVRVVDTKQDLAADYQQQHGKRPIGANGDDGRVVGIDGGKRHRSAA